MSLRRATIFRHAAAIVLPLLPLTQAGGAALDTIGVAALREQFPELTGAGQTVAIAEALEKDGDWQVSPTAVGVPAALFGYYDTNNPYPLGTTFSSDLSSGHANTVAGNFIAPANGVAPGVQDVEVFQALYFLNEVVGKITDNAWTPVAIDAAIVNQSFISATTDPSTIAMVGRYYDAYANQFGTFFVNAANNGSSATTYAPGSMHNGITVGRTDGVHSAGVHVVAPANATSYATPYVAGSATLLRQAAQLGHFSATGAANPADSRVLKAGLINGAIKTDDWSQTETNPLDNTFGAGVVDVHTSHSMLSGGQHARSALTSAALGTTTVNIPPSNVLSALNGWDLATLTATASTDAVAHYFFDLTSSVSISLTATLTWNSIASISAGSNRLSNFDLVLVESVSQSILWRSRSTTENVEHIFLSDLAGGIYDLQVIMRGGPSAPFLSDTYAVVWSWTGLSVVPESGIAWAIGFGGFLCAVVILRRKVRRSSNNPV